MPLTFVVRTVSTARRPVCVTYCSIDSTRSRRFDLNAGDMRAVTSRSSPTKSRSAAMATGSGRPSTVRADSGPMSEVSAGAAAASTGGTLARGAVPGAGAAVAVAVGVGVSAPHRSRPSRSRVKAWPFAVTAQRDVLAARRRPAVGAVQDTWLSSALAAAVKAPRDARAVLDGRHRALPGRGEVPERQVVGVAGLEGDDLGAWTAATP